MVNGELMPEVLMSFDTSPLKDNSQFTIHHSHFIPSTVFRLQSPVSHLPSPNSRLALLPFSTMTVKGVLTTVALLAVIAPVTAAQIKLVIKPDGTKAIIDVGGGGAGRGANLNWLASKRDRVTEFEDLISRYSQRAGLDPVFVKAVIQVESDFNNWCVSNKGARGLMQLMPATAKRFGVTSVHDPEQNIRGGVTYLRFLMDLFGSNMTKVLAAYNAGEGAVKRYGGVPPYKETQDYVQRALTVYHGKPWGSISLGSLPSGRKLKGGFKEGETFGSLPPPVPTGIERPGVKLLSAR